MTEAARKKAADAEVRRLKAQQPRGAAAEEKAHGSESSRQGPWPSSGGSTRRPSR